MQRVKFLRVMVFAIAGSFFFTNAVFSQKNIAAKGEKIANFENHPQLKSHLRHWEIYDIDAKKLYESTDEYLFDLSFDFEGKHQFTTKLYPNNIRSGDYHVITQSKKGRKRKKGSQAKTFSGYISKADAGSVSLTIDKDFIYGYFQAEGTTYYIEPLWYYIPGQPKNLFILYDERDAINDGKNTCAAIETAEKTEELAPQSKSETALRAATCYEIELAVASDYKMFQKYGSVTDVENHNIGVMNNVNTNFAGQFNWDISFLVMTPQYIVSASGADPWTASTDVDDLINSFTQWGRGGGFGYSFDLGQLWSNRNFDGSTVGYAWIGVLCGNSKYHILQDYTSNANSLRVLVAHEIGHNLSARHDAPGSGFIMAPSINNTNAWSAASKTKVNNHIQSRIGIAGCLSPCTATQPPVADFTADKTGNICIGATVIFTDNSSENPTSWLWSFPGGTPNSSTAQNPTVIYSALGTNNVSLTATNDIGNNSITKNNLIIVNVFPVANAGLDMQLSCVNTSVMLDGSTSDSGADIAYQWTTADGNIVSGGTTNQATVDAIGTYTLTVTNTATGCEKSNSAVVTNDATLPTAEAGVDVSITCSSGSPINIGGNSTTGATITYSWTTPDGNIVSGANSKNAAVDTQGTYTLTVTNTATSCASSDVIIVTEDIVFPPADAGKDASLNCENNEVRLGGDSGVGGNYTYAWTTPDGNIISGANTANANADAIGTYTLTVTNPVTGCESSDVVLLTGNTTMPTANAGTGKSIDCNNPTVMIGGNSSSGANISYFWSTNNGHIVSGTNTITATIDKPGTYFLYVTDNNNFCTAESQVIVGGDITPPVADAGNDKDLTCDNPIISIGGNSAAGGNIAYVWTTSNGNIVSGANVKQATINAIGTYTITVENTATGCTNTDQVVVGGNDVPPIADAGEGMEINCTNPNITIGGNSTTGGNISYKWTTADGNIVSGASEAQATIDAGGTYNLTVTNTTSGCASVADITITEDKNIPTVSAGDDAILQQGESVALNGSGSGTSFIWSPISGLDDPNISTPTASPEVATTYTLTVTADNGCSTTDEVFVAVLEKIVNSFSPNGDGLNEIWSIGGLEYFADSRITIFNRTGRNVFDSKENRKTYWDGMFNGKVLPTGTYFYIIRLDKEGKEIKGHVNIIK